MCPILVISILESTRNPTCAKNAQVRTLAKNATVDLIIMVKKSEIAKADAAQLQQLENIENLIHVIRGKQVMLDVDLARLYGVETKRLNEQVKRNMDRFPEDFMFQLSKDEVDFLRSQIATLENGDNNVLRSQIATIENEGNGLRSQIVTLDMRGRHVKYMPYAFTENGIAMLSGVLRSQQAININIQIMRAFTAMRHFIASNAQVFQRLEVIERNQLAMNASQAELSSHLAENDKKQYYEGFVTSKNVQKDPTCIHELHTLIKTHNDYQEADIDKRYTQIIDAFIDYVGANDLLL